MSVKINHPNMVQKLELYIPSKEDVLLGNKRHHEVNTYQDIESSVQIEATYFNQQSLAFEPLLEAWPINLQLTQGTPYSAMNVSVYSKDFLNVNLTFGMALTTAKILDRLDQSLKQAEDLDSSIYVAQAQSVSKSSGRITRYTTTLMKEKSE